MSEIKSEYNASQEILYTVCEEAWNLCSQYLQKFANLKPKYNTAFIEASLQAVDDAKALMPSRETIGLRKEARINLISATNVLQESWQCLKVYITAAFNKDILATKLEVAGASLYKKASYDNWSSVRSLVSAGNSFINSNLDTLMDKDNMPADFPAIYKSAGDDCNKLSGIFFNLDIEKEEATDKKVKANNEIYRSLIAMLKDGQRVFAADSILKKQFVFTHLKSIYKGEGAASLSGYILNDENLPLQGATVTTKDLLYKGTSDKKGYYRISRIAEGTYLFTVNCPGYTPLEQQATFIAGKTTRFIFSLQNI